MIYGKKPVRPADDPPEVEVTRPPSERAVPQPPPTEEEDTLSPDTINGTADMIRCGLSPEQIGRAWGNRELAIHLYMDFMANMNCDPGCICEKCGGADEVEPCRCVWAAPIPNQKQQYHNFITYHAFCRGCLRGISFRRNAAHVVLMLLYLLSIVTGFAVLLVGIAALNSMSPHDWNWGYVYYLLTLGLLLGVSIWGLLKLRRVAPPRCLADIGRKPFFLADIA